MHPALAASDVNPFDAALLRLLNCDLSSPGLDAFLRAAQDKWVAVPVFLGALLVLAFFDRRTVLRAIAAAAAAWGVSMLIASLLWVVVERPRPTTVYGPENMLRTHAEIATCASQPDKLVVRGYPAGSPSFPSRHAATAGVFAMVLTLGWGWWGSPGWIFALLVAFGRVHKGVHWPTDALAGLALGALVAWGAWRAVPRVLGLVGLRGLVHAPEIAPDPDPGPDSEAASGADAGVG